MRSRREEIRQSNCNAYISGYADLLCVQLIISAPDEYIDERIFAYYSYSQQW